MRENNDELIEFNCTGYLRLILMVFVCFWAFSSPDPSGVVNSLSGFAIPAFFILSGYYVLDNKRNVRMEKTLRKIKRTAISFGFVFLFYAAINVVLIILHFKSFTFSKRMLFEFVVMNVWPFEVGSNIWFIQAMLYAYIIIFLADKMKLMKYYKIFIPVLIIIMLLTGELSRTLRFNIFGYQYIPGNWLTRALPYILIGKLLRDMKKSVMKIQFWKFLIAFVIGGVLVIAEILCLGWFEFLGYQGHMFGYGIMAVAVCGLGGLGARGQGDLGTGTWGTVGTRGTGWRDCPPTLNVHQSALSTMTMSMEPEAGRDLDWHLRWWTLVAMGVGGHCQGSAVSADSA